MFLGEGIFQYSTKRNKKFFLFLLFCSIGVQYQWNEIVMHLTVKLLIHIRRFKSKFGANIPLLEKMEISLNNRRNKSSSILVSIYIFCLEKVSFFKVFILGAM